MSFLWRHARIHIDVKAEDGTVTNWMIEAAAPNSLLRRARRAEAVGKSTR
jgi:hypothetical protein